MQLLSGEVPLAQSVEPSAADASRGHEAVLLEAPKGHLHARQRDVEQASQFACVAFIKQTQGEECSRARPAAEGTRHDH